ncbi:MAG: hypothetical protein ACJ74H_06930 [Thermoanaerobaculia bacterium]
MKRLIMVLVVLFTAATLFAGGKECDINKHAKNVELTGTIASVGTGDEAKTVFRVANTNDTYTVCEKTKASVLKLANSGAVRVKGKLVTCGEGQELVIDEANKI